MNRKTKFVYAWLICVGIPVILTALSLDMGEARDSLLVAAVSFAAIGFCLYRKYPDMETTPSWVAWVLVLWIPVVWALTLSALLFFDYQTAQEKRLQNQIQQFQQQFRENNTRE